MTLYRISRYCGKRSTPLLNPPPRPDCVGIPFMVRGPHHERNCVTINSSTYAFALSLSKGSETIATQSRRGEGHRWGLERFELGVVGDSALDRLPRIIQLANAAGGDKP